MTVNSHLISINVILWLPCLKTLAPPAAFGTGIKIRFLCFNQKLTGRRSPSWVMLAEWWWLQTAACHLLVPGRSFAFIGTRWNSYTAVKGISKQSFKVTFYHYTVEYFLMCVNDIYFRLWDFREVWLQRDVRWCLKFPLQKQKPKKVFSTDSLLPGKKPRSS